MTTVGQSTNDLLRDYLNAQIDKQFREFFPRTVPPPGLTVASERPAPVVPSPPSPAAGAGCSFDAGEAG